MKKQRYTNASDIGRVAFCPRSVSLEKKCKSINQDAQRRRKRGDIAHQRFNNRLKQNRQSPCFIATEIYGDSHPTTERFRDFRDSHLSNWPATWLVSLYYATSPHVCVLIRHCPTLRRMFTKLLNAIDSRLQN